MTLRDRPSRWGNVEHARMPTPMLGAAQDLVLALPAPQFAHPDSERPIKKTIPAAAGTRPYNILWVLMESTGLDYALKPAPGSDGNWVSSRYSANTATSATRRSPGAGTPSRQPSSASAPATG